MIAWHLAEGYIAIPKSNSRDRMAENLASVDLALTPAEVASITAMERAGRVGGNPDEVE